MTARKKKGPPRPRRVFSAEFKLEAVQRAEERRVAGVPLTQIARELGVTDELLRRWKRHARTRVGGRPADVFPGHGRLPSDDRANAQIRAVLLQDRKRVAICFLRFAEIGGAELRTIFVKSLVHRVLRPSRASAQRADASRSRIPPCPASRSQAIEPRRARLAVLPAPVLS